MPRWSATAMGAARALVGVALLVAPGAALSIFRRDEPSAESVLLMRTIGIRDLVLGVGTVISARSGDDGAARRWLLAGLSSDSLDVGSALVSRSGIGSGEAAFAGGSALSFVVLDLLTLRSVAPAGSGA